MEQLKVIFEGLGGRELERIFKNFFLLSVLLKQIMISFFAGYGEIPEHFSIPEEQKEVINRDISSGTSEENSSDPSTFQLMATESQLEKSKITIPENSFSEKN